MLEFRSISQPVIHSTPSHVTNNVWILDNVLCRQPNGDHGLRGTEGLNMYMGDPPPVDRRFKGNVMFVPNNDMKYSFPPTNTLQTKIVYADPSTANYQIISPNWTQTTDGTIAGVNESRLSAARKLDVSAPTCGTARHCYASGAANRAVCVFVNCIIVDPEATRR